MIYKGYSISIWDSEEDAIANEQSGYYKEQVGKFAEFMAAPLFRKAMRLPFKAEKLAKRPLADKKCIDTKGSATGGTALLTYLCHKSIIHH